MRIEHSITTVSWIPSDLLEGMGKMATRMKLAKHDQPPPDRLEADIPGALETLRAADGFRFANHLSAHVERGPSGQIINYGYGGGGTIGATTVDLGIGSITIPAIKLPDLRAKPDVAADRVTFTQTVGGRTGAAMPRAVKHPPFVQYHAPIVWTTLELTIWADGRHEGRMTGASGFPRHWVYDEAGALIAKSSLADYKQWMNDSFGRRTPWGDEDQPALVTEVETLLERELQGAIMRGEVKPSIRRLTRGNALVEQGVTQADELFLLLNGVLAVEVDGEPLAEIGPGAVLGERGILEGGRRTATLRAVTDCKVAVVPADQIDHERLAQLAGGHHREKDRRIEG